MGLLRRGGLVAQGPWVQGPFGLALGKILRQKFFCVKNFLCFFSGPGFIFSPKSEKISRDFAKPGQCFRLKSQLSLNMFDFYDKISGQKKFIFFA
jgi:hypothetical protein